MSKKIDRDERIGERLLRFNIIDTYHVRNVLIRQKHGDKRKFGDIAVDLGYIGKNKLESCLQTKGMDLYDTNFKKSTNYSFIKYSHKKAK